MTETPSAPPDANRTEPDRETDDDHGPRVTRGEVRDLSRLRRTTGPDRSIAGVAGGLGRHLDVDPVILKVAFVVLAFFGGGGLLLYAALWLLVPDDRSPARPLGLDDRSRGLALVVLAGVAAILVLGAGLGPRFGIGSISVPVLILGGIALLIWRQVSRRREDRREARGAARAYPGDTLRPPYDASPPTAPVDVTSTMTPGLAESAGYDARSPYAAPPAPPRYADPSWAPVLPPEPAAPRRTGPILFWFTLALAALGVGVLGVVDLAGAPVPGPAYPGLVLGLVGAMLTLGAFWGRAGGLILVGLLTVPWLVGSLADQSVGGDAVRYGPASASEVRPRYTIDNGEVVLDLRGVRDIDALAGRTVTLDGDIGHLQVLVPAGLAVDARAQIDGPGGWNLFGSESAGIGTSGSGSSLGDAPDGAAPTPLVIDGHLEAGVIEVQTNGSIR